MVQQQQLEVRAGTDTPRQLRKAHALEMAVVRFPERRVRKAAHPAATAAYRSGSRRAVELYLNQLLGLKILEFSSDLQVALHLAACLYHCYTLLPLLALCVW
jgi:hypothetical protein